MAKDSESIFWSEIEFKICRWFGRPRNCSIVIGRWIRFVKLWNIKTIKCLYSWTFSKRFSFWVISDLKFQDMIVWSVRGEEIISKCISVLQTIKIQWQTPTIFYAYRKHVIFLSSITTGLESLNLFRVQFSASINALAAASFLSLHIISNSKCCFATSFSHFTILSFKRIDNRFYEPLSGPS